MADTKDNLEQQVENIIRAGFAQQDDNQDDTITLKGTSEKRVLDVDLYRLHNGAVLLVPNNGTSNLDLDSIESIASTEDTEITDETPPLPLVEEDQQEGISQKQEPQRAGRKKQGKPSVLLISLILLCLLVTGIASSLYLLPLTATATVTITPKAKSRHAQTTLTIAAHPKGGQVQGRELQAISLTKSITVPATGHAHNDATIAEGVLTFYNADVSPSTIVAGTSFTVQGLTVVTDSPVTVQAAVPPSFGIGITAAHVIQAGAGGNLPAHTLYARCCGNQFITATNTTPFSGGQDARSYSYIQTSDIQNAASTLFTSLTPLAAAQLQHHVQTGEHLVMPVCSPSIQQSVRPGAIGTQVTVSVTQNCTSVAYTLASLQQVATSTLARSLPLAQYEQVDTTQVTVNGSTYANHSAMLNVSLSGVWVYRFTKEQLAVLTHQIVGKSQAKAKAILEQGAGVAQVSIHLERLDFKDELPANPQRISVQFFYLVS